MKKTPSLFTIATLGLITLLAPAASRADDPWGTWPAGQNPTTVGTQVVQNLLDRTKLDSSKGLTYLETCSGFGAVRFALSFKDHDLLTKAMARYQSMITTDGTGLLPKPNHVDRSIFGILPLEMYRVTNDQKYLALALSYADVQFAPPLNPEGLSSETRYYIDDVYKISVMQIRAFTATKKPEYATQAVKEATAFIDKLQQPTGLFFHGPDAHVYWGRGNGWVAAALAEILMGLPSSDPGHDKILTAYKSMMAGLLKVQAPDGRWRQVLDDNKAWEENSCTGYFIFAMAEGVNNGWLDSAIYQPAVKKAWSALCTQIDPKGNIADVGVLTEHSNDEAYYLARPRASGNLHGQFATMWAATALLNSQQ